MELSNSNDWYVIQQDLQKKSKGLKHNRDIRKMIDNLQISVTELSKAEVLARRGKPQLAQELKVKINEEIKTVEGYLLMAALIG